MDDKLFNDLITSVNEAIQHEKGKVHLKSTIVEIPDDEIAFYNVYKMLSNKDKHIAMDFVNDLLRVSLG